ncbi:MAG: MOSC domain-containing protein [Pseudomonadota bacterium]
MVRHLNMEELEAGLEQVRLSPKDDGVLEMVVVRPEHDQRLTPDCIEISLAGGLSGDHWAKGCHLQTDDGRPHPDVQICIMNARMIDLIAQGRDRWALAGDNLFVDLDLSDDNLKAGQQLKIGGAVIEITAEPHKGCAKFIERYGKAACQFVNSRVGRELHLRGIYARVVQDGRINVGDRIVKIDGASNMATEAA